jgi:polyisoprenoid-binding protein YceI
MRIVTVAAVAWLAACSPREEALAPAPAPVTTEAPAGEYRMDKSHTDLSFRVDHIGFSRYTARFTEVDATLRFDPADPAQMSVNATIAVNSLALPSPPQGFRESLLGPDWFDAEQFPAITFMSTAVELTGPNTARVIGDLTLHGVTKPIILEAAFNGGYAGHPQEPNARIGMSARGSFSRSDFGIALGVPPPGSTMGVGDEVEVIVETEFNGPAWTPPAQEQHAAP